MNLLHRSVRTCTRVRFPERGLFRSTSNIHRRQKTPARGRRYPSLIDPLLSSKPTPVRRRSKNRNPLLLTPRLKSRCAPRRKIVHRHHFIHILHPRPHHIRPNLKSAKQSRHRMPHETRFPIATRLAPLPRPRLQPQHQRRARLRIRLLLHHHQNRRRIFHRAPTPKPRIQRHIPHNFRCDIAQIHRDHSESARLNQQIRRAQRLIRVLAAHPQHPLQRHSRRARRRRIKTVARIDQRARFTFHSPRRQRRQLHARPPRTRRPTNFRHRATRQSADHGVQRRNSRRHHLKNISIAIVEWRNDAPAQVELNFGAKFSQCRRGSHKRSNEKAERVRGAQCSLFLRLL